MKVSIWKIAGIFVVILTGAVMLLSSSIKENTISLDSRSQVLALNEIIKLSEEAVLNGTTKAHEELQSSAETMKQQLKNDMNKKQTVPVQQIFYLYGICLLFLFTVISYFYIKLLRPFKKLEVYAAEIAKGNLDATLRIERQNFFGSFTWAFDHMRREIIKARSCEKEAIENNKTVIATLSHDIKTPIASIRAYAEGLEAHMDTSRERRQRYLSVIIRKCDEVTKLTNDLFIHSLADLDKLKLHEEQTAVIALLQELKAEFLNPDGRIQWRGNEQDAAVFSDICVCVDIRRLYQAVDNLIRNSYKYAKDSDIEIHAYMMENEFILSIRDFGQGIPAQDMPFIFEKFYRGKNICDEEGAGLGLYIVRYIIEQMRGSIRLNNTDSGLEAIISLPAANS